MYTSLIVLSILGIDSLFFKTYVFLPSLSCIFMWSYVTPFRLCLPAYTSTKTFPNIKFPDPRGVVELFARLKTYFGPVDLIDCKVGLQDLY